MNQTETWVDGAASMAALLGVQSAQDLTLLLPPSVELPAWWLARQTASGAEARAHLVAARLMRLWMAIQETSIR